MIDQLKNENENYSHFVEDNRNPCIQVDMDGLITHANVLFQNNFNVNHGDNFLSLLTTKQGKVSWDEFKQEANETKAGLLENLSMAVSANVEVICKAHIFYCHFTHSAVITFVLPAVCTELPESDYLTCFSKSSRAILMINAEGIIVDVNNRVKKLFQLSPHELIGKQIHSIYRKFNTQKRNAEIQYTNYLKTLLLHGEVVFTERFEDDPNEIKFIEIRVIYDSDTNLYVMELTDCTEIELLRRQLDHSGSLSTVGQMAASIAHEIRNPMTTLKGFVQLMEVTATGDTANYLTVVDSELHRMESILNEMLMLSKPSEEKISEFSLGVLVTKVLEIMKPKAMFESIHINWTDASFCNSIITSNADKLKQVLLNIFKNAFEAMEEGGTLTLNLERDTSASFKLTVSDSGQGMSELQIKSIFMPFFTSKPEGTGLGLPFVLKTMEELGGSVAVTSEQGSGTTFVLDFPQNCFHSSLNSTNLSAN